MDIPFAIFLPAMAQSTDKPNIVFIMGADGEHDKPPLACPVLAPKQISVMREAMSAAPRVNAGELLQQLAGAKVQQ